MGNNFEKRYLDYSDSDSIRRAMESWGKNISDGYRDGIRKGLEDFQNPPASNITEAVDHAKAALNSVFGIGVDYSTAMSYTPSRPAAYRIKNVIFNPPATIIFWADNTKTVVKCGPYDRYDPEKGLAMAFCKKMMGNHGNYYNVFKKWLPEESETMEDKPLTSISMYEPQTFTFTLDPSCVKVEDIFGNAFDLSTGRTINKEDNDHE